MPEIKQNDAGEYCLEGYGEADACYPSEDEAKAAVEALSAEAAEETPVVEDDAPSEDMPADTEPEAEEEAPSDTATVDVPSGIRKLVLNIGAEVAKAFGKKDDPFTGFKVVGNNWLAVWSNNFKDRDGELFPEQAIDAYVARSDMGVVPQPDLWVWHLGKSVRIGEADWVGRHGHFLFAAGTFDTDTHAQAAKAYYVRNAHKTTISHGFTFPPDAFDGKAYHSFNTFEISLLPSGAEANLYTSLAGVKEMALNDAKKKYMEEVFGKERAEQILADWDKRGKALEELNVEYKDFVAAEPGKAVTDAKALEQADATFKELFPALFEGSGTAVEAALEAVKAAKAANDQYADAMKQIDALRAEMQLRPRVASQDSATVLDTTQGKGKELLDTVHKQMTEIDPFWGTPVVKTP